MFATCGKLGLSEKVLTHLRELGRQIHAGHQPLVFDDGFVSLIEQRGSEVNKYEEPKPGPRPEAGPRQRQRASWRTRSTGQAKPFRSRAVEDAFGAGFRLLAQHYEVLGYEDKNGLWITVKTKPLGCGGPQAYLIVAIPLDMEISPRAWAFESLGCNAKLFGMKHTNFPDASICAFTKASKAWVAEDGLLPLVDHYSLWIIKSWHRSILGWWPGPQIGACALYRRREFVPEELCGCESGALYGLCHHLRDMQVPEEHARQEFRRLFLVEYENRRPPFEVMRAARSSWKSMPDLARVFADRKSSDEPMVPLI